MKKRAADDIEPSIGELIRLGTVVALDLATARLRLRFGDPDAADVAETGWIPWATARSGKTRVWSPPSIGEQMILLSPDGQIGNAVAIPAIPYTGFPALRSDTVEAIAWEDGALASYDPGTSTLELVLPAGATVLIESPGGVTVEALGGITLRGDVEIEGDVTVTGRVNVSEDVDAAGVSLKNHRHLAVQTGNSQSGPPA